MAKVKYCVFDVGKTIYDYSLEPLDKVFSKEVKDLKAYEEKGKVFKYDYDPYMKGEVSYPDFCKDLCESFGVAPSKNMQAKINMALHKGVGEYYKETKKAMEENKKAGIKNCILSNALPILADTGNVNGLVDAENVFCSFDLGLLKPDAKIFTAVKEKLGCEYNEMVFVDDKQKNVDVAKSLGINGIVYDRKTINQDLKKYQNSFDLPKTKDGKGR